MPLSRIRALIRNLFDRGRADRELDDELRAYVDLLSEEHERRGEQPADARRAALLEVRGADRVKERVRDAPGRPCHRAGVAGRAIRPPHAPPESRIRDRRCRDTRPGHRSEYRHLQRALRRAAEAAPLPGSRPSGRSRSRVPRPGTDTVYALARQLLGLARPGTSLCYGRRDPVRHRQPDGIRVSRATSSAGGLGRFPGRARPPAGGRASVSAGRGPARKRHARRGADRGVLASPLRRQSEHRRTNARARQPTVPCHRCSAIRSRVAGRHRRAPSRWSVRATTIAAVSS